MELDQFEHHHLLKQNLHKCLNNKSLRKRVQQFQYSLKQRQHPSLATAIWWLEHIMENPQANDDLLASLKERPNFLIWRSLDIIVVVQILLILCAINTIIVMRQTILNLKNMSKRSKKKVDKLHKN